MNCKKIIKCLFRFVIFLIILFVIFILTLFYSGKKLTNKENLGEYVKTAEVLNMQVNIMFDIDEEITIKEKLYQMGLDKGIPREIMTDILKSEEINILLGEYFNKAFYYLVNTQEKPNITLEESYKIVDIALESLENHLNEMMSEEELVEKIELFCLDLVNMVPNRQEILGGISLSFLKNFLNFKYYNFVLVLILCFFCLLLSTKKVYKTFRYFSLAMIINGFLYVILGTLNIPITNYILLNVNNLKILVEPLVTILLTIWFKLGVGLSFTGIFLIIIYVVVNRININKELLYK